MCKRCARSTVTDGGRQWKEAGSLLSSSSQSWSKTFTGFNVKILLGFWWPFASERDRMPSSLATLSISFSSRRNLCSSPITDTPWAARSPCPHTCLLPTSQGSAQSRPPSRLLGAICKIHTQSPFISTALTLIQATVISSQDYFVRASKLSFCFYSWEPVYAPYTKLISCHPSAQNPPPTPSHLAQHLSQSLGRGPGST